MCARVYTSLVQAQMQAHPSSLSHTLSPSHPHTHTHTHTLPPQVKGQDVGSVDGGRVLFFGCKGETHTHKQGFKQLFRRLRTMFKPERLDSLDDFRQDHLKGAQICVLGCPREKYTKAELEVFKRYVKQGGSVLVLLSEGGETRNNTNINAWLEEYGIFINNDAVVRTMHYKYLHPKEVFISDGILNRGILAAVGGNKAQDSEEPDDFRATKAKQAFDNTGLEFVYPYGATLSVDTPKAGKAGAGALPVAILSSGKIAYPMNRPLGEWAEAIDDGVQIRPPLFKFQKPRSGGGTCIK